MGSPFTCVCSAELSQARHSKQQLTVDLNSGVYLRTSKTQAFALPDCLTPACPPQHCARLVSTPLSHRAITAVGCRVTFCCATTHGHHPPRSLGAPSIHLHLQDLHPLPSRIFPPTKVFIPILGLLLLSRSQESLCAGAQCVIRPLPGGPVSCLFMNSGIQDMPCLFSSGVIKTYD